MRPGTETWLGAVSPANPAIRPPPRERPLDPAPDLGVRWHPATLTVLAVLAGLAIRALRRR